MKFQRKLVAFVFQISILNSAITKRNGVFFSASRSLKWHEQIAVETVIRAVKQF